MKIVRGMVYGKWGNSKITTNTIHAVNSNNSYSTLCGIDFKSSEILGLSEEQGDIKINCKRCLNKLQKGERKWKKQNTFQNQ